MHGSALMSGFPMNRSVLKGNRESYAQRTINYSAASCPLGKSMSEKWKDIRYRSAAVGK